jgi:hypothetical protein
MNRTDIRWNLATKVAEFLIVAGAVVVDVLLIAGKL